MTEKANKAALNGVRVLDFSRFLAGPLCGMLLADMGAEVIRVEPLGGTPDRRWGLVGADGETLTFKILGRNKKSITLNLSTQKGKEISRMLVETSDIVLHNFPLGTTLANEFSFDRLTHFRPEIIVAILSGYGLNGPDAEEICFDFVTQARAGMMTLNGFPGSPPLKTAVPYVDCCSGMAIALGALVALYNRQKTGKGQLVDVALFDIASFITQSLGALIYYKIHNELRQQLGNFGFSSYMSCLKAKDGWVMVVPSTDNFWNKFIKAIGKEDELGRDVRFSSDMSRGLNSTSIDQIVQLWAAERTTDEILDTLKAARVACSKVNSVDYLLKDPQSLAREMVVHTTYPVIGEIPIPGIPIKLSETSGSIRSLAPRVGENNEEVYCGLLKLTPDELRQLEAEGII